MFRERGMVDLEAIVNCHAERSEESHSPPSFFAALSMTVPTVIVHFDE
jgi:hypothetical protein